jgi:hypothetical protein
MPVHLFFVKKVSTEALEPCEKKHIVSGFARHFDGLYPAFQARCQKGSDPSPKIVAKGISTNHHSLSSDAARHL